MRTWTWIVAVTLVAGLLAGGMAAYAQGTGKGAGHKGANFVDANSDGVCDSFVDADGNGVCDKKGTCGKGKNFVDANGDGVCDNQPSGQACRRQQGNGTCQGGQCPSGGGQHRGRNGQGK